MVYLSHIRCDGPVATPQPQAHVSDAGRATEARGNTSQGEVTRSLRDETKRQTVPRVLFGGTSANGGRTDLDFQLMLLLQQTVLNNVPLAL